MLSFATEYYAMQMRVKNDITRTRAVQFLPVEQREEILKGAADGGDRRSFARTHVQ